MLIDSGFGVVILGGSEVYWLIDKNGRVLVGGIYVTGVEGVVSPIGGDVVGFFNGNEFHLEMIDGSVFMFHFLLKIEELVVEPFDF